MLAAIATSISIGFNILLPVVPALVERGGPHGAAGAATAAFFGAAVAGEVFTPWLMSRWSSARLLIGGQLITAAPSLVFAIPHAPASLMLGATAARGLGMGFTIVVSTALIAELAPPERRGHSVGIFGLALTAPGIVVPSIGVTLLEAGRVDAAALIAFAISLAGAVLVFMLPRHPVRTPGSTASLLGAFRRRGLVLLFSSFVLVSSSFGGVITFVPIALPAAGIGSAAAFLFVAGVARAATRWLAGVLGDRLPGRRVLVGSIGLTALGLIALASRATPLVVVFAGIAFGAGYGGAQTAFYLGMTGRGSSRHHNAVSALWNIGIDLGSSLGGSLMGLAASRYGYGAAIWGIPAVAVLALVPLLLAPGRPEPDSGAEPTEPLLGPARALGP